MNKRVAIKVYSASGEACGMKLDDTKPVDVAIHLHHMTIKELMDYMVSPGDSIIIAIGGSVVTLALLDEKEHQCPIHQPSSLN